MTQTTTDRERVGGDEMTSSNTGKEEPLSDLSGGTPDWPARAIIEGDNIVIRVPISALPVAFDFSPLTPRDDEADAKYFVSDTAEFAKSVCRRLNKEEEDGTTPIHLMLDSAMEEALEQGDEGLEECRTA